MSEGFPGFVVSDLHLNFNFFPFRSILKAIVHENASLCRQIELPTSPLLDKQTAQLPALMLKVCF